MRQKKTVNKVFILSLSALAIFAFFISSFLNKVRAQDSFTLCMNSGINQYLILSAPNACPSGFTASPSDSDLSGYSPVSDYSLYLNNNTNNNSQTGSQSGTGTNIPSTNQTDLQNNTQPVIPDQDVVIDADPSLATGPFLNLDPSDYPYCVSLTKDLSFGLTDNKSKGEVSTLQAYLTDRGFLETGATGYFGRSTDMAVRRFQYRNQISVTGIVTQDFRDVLKELTCQKYQKISYVDKPIASSKYVSKNTDTAPVQKTVVIPATKVQKAKKVIIPATNSKNSNTVSITPAQTNPNPIPSVVLDNSKLSSPYGVLSLSKRNGLYFTFNSTSPSPVICINLNGVDCSSSVNNSPIKEGVNGAMYEVVNISGAWSFTIYPGSVWGAVGNRVNIYLKDSVNSNTISIYTVSVSN